MLEEQAKIPPPASKLQICWRAGIATYRHANLVTHHLLGALLTLVVVAYFLFCGLFLGLRYVVLPNVGYYKAEVEHIVSKTVGNPISIGTIQASWHGLQPRLVLDNVVVHDKGGQPALTLPQVAATISWRSALVGAVRLASLEINKPDLQIERDAQGNLFVAGILVNSKQENDGAGAEWLLAQRKIVIRGGQVRWRDDLRKAPELVLANIDAGDAACLICGAAGSAGGFCPSGIYPQDRRFQALDRHPLREPARCRPDGVEALLRLSLRDQPGQGRGASLA
jgi:hypothetical protein